MHKKADRRHEMMRMASRTTSVAAKPGAVMQMRPSLSDRDGNTMVVVLSLVCSRANVRSPVDTTYRHKPNLLFNFQLLVSIRLETKSCRIWPLIYVTKYDRT